ncbi:UDP-GlcNAc:undecaprenyl-phosphate/decaprenyl-phosphate GlcNAc-1-phosphate transferase [Candidatus Hakubella thermalkaliphila]|uniref:UDP-GlcNAc:undecaprenyl-phosphate/decaprenyl-phosphate GlcNAc-1-phosphate transferase n=1 Tax=Candidatus Hakubella thermalkaliphila TaxID=2754717 RepID=A0A6V8NZN2_9ACTN|nr:UDP-GlcNAc:undecaprenyl-phosphate/decaprenyl-phosphate GlcNAc-1-phosphate transferase [Candidatus Hakubella thermalkaliphila]
MTTDVAFVSSFLGAFILTIILTPLVKKVALKGGAYVDPVKNRDERHIHTQIIPRLGGVAIFLSFLAISLIHLGISGRLIGVLIGASLILIVGVWDDLRGLTALQKLFWQIVAAVIVVASGIGIDFITNPLGGVIQLDTPRILLVTVNGNPYGISVWGDLLTIFWIVAMINTLNFLDGLDGLATGVTGIGALVVFGISLASGGPELATALLAIILAGAALGFFTLQFLSRPHLSGRLRQHVPGVYDRCSVDHRQR